MQTEVQNFIVRPACEADIPTMLQLADEGRQTMRANGNMRQWSPSYPNTEVFRRDIERQGSFLVIEPQTQRAVATFAFLASPEPTYAVIEGGAWIDDTLPYYVIHRIAAKHGSKGIFDTIMNFALERCTNLRMDTHRDNLIMRHLLEKYNFSYCGIIHVANGDERLAYQLLTGEANTGK